MDRKLRRLNCTLSLLLEAWNGKEFKKCNQSIPDGKVYTAVSKVPDTLGSSFLLLTPIGSLMGWLFAEVIIIFYILWILNLSHSLKKQSDDYNFLRHRKERRMDSISLADYSIEQQMFTMMIIMQWRSINNSLEEIFIITSRVRWVKERMRGREIIVFHVWH